MRVAIRRDPQGLFPDHNAGRSPNASFSVACDLPQPFVVLGLSRASLRRGQTASLR
jgi:hypothetical protein